MAKKIVLGLDFDGVVAYNPLRVARLPISFFKQKFLGVKKLTFFYPQKEWQKALWAILHESSLFPACGVSLLRQMVAEGRIEAHLLSGRYGFVGKGLERFLARWRMRELFTTISCNNRSEQPHLFKEKIIQKYRFDYYVEDNWDVVQYLFSRTKTKVFWIYNILDRGKQYQYKFPFLEKALKEISSKSQIPNSKS